MTRGEQIAADIRRDIAEDLRKTGTMPDVIYLPRADYDELETYLTVFLCYQPPVSENVDELKYCGVLVQPTTEIGKTLKGLWWDTDKMRDLRNYWKSKGMQT